MHVVVASRMGLLNTFVVQTQPTAPLLKCFCLPGRQGGHIPSRIWHVLLAASLCTTASISDSLFLLSGHSQGFLYFQTSLLGHALQFCEACFIPSKVGPFRHYSSPACPITFPVITNSSLESFSQRHLPLCYFQENFLENFA